VDRRRQSADVAALGVGSILCCAHYSCWNSRRETSAWTTRMIRRKDVCTLSRVQLHRSHSDPISLAPPPCAVEPGHYR